MDLQDVQRVDRATWRRYLFYIDLIVIAIFVVSLALLVRHTFLAGQLFNMNAADPSSGAWGLHTQTMWLVVTDTAFLVGSMLWIFYRFFRNEYTVMTKRF